MSQQKQGTLTQKIRALKPQKTGKTGEILVQKTGIQDRILNLNIQKSWNSQLPNVGFGAKESPNHTSSSMPPESVYPSPSNM